MQQSLRDSDLRTKATHRRCTPGPRPLCRGSPYSHGRRRAERIYSQRAAQSTVLSASQVTRQTLLSPSEANKKPTSQAFFVTQVTVRGRIVSKPFRSVRPCVTAARAGPRPHLGAAHKAAREHTDIGGGGSPCRKKHLIFLHVQ